MLIENNWSYIKENTKEHYVVKKLNNKKIGMWILRIQRCWEDRHELTTMVTGIKGDCMTRELEWAGNKLFSIYPLWYLKFLPCKYTI